MMFAVLVGVFDGDLRFPRTSYLVYDSKLCDAG
jgi:hypothetical protein